MARCALLVMLLNALILHSTEERLFDTNQWLCSAAVNISQLKVHFFKVNYAAGEDVGETALTYLLLNVTNWEQESEFKWCIFQVNLTQDSDGKNTKRFWACKADTIVNLAEQLVENGNIASVLNVTDQVLDVLKTKDLYNLQVIRQMIGCAREGTAKRFQISLDNIPAATDWTTESTAVNLATIGTLNSTENVAQDNSNNVSSKLTLSTKSNWSNVNLFSFARNKRGAFGMKFSSTGKHSNHTNTHRSIVFPLVGISSVVAGTVAFLLCYVYVCDGPRVGRESGKPKAKQSDVSLVGSFIKAEGKSELKSQVGLQMSSQTSHKVASNPVAVPSTGPSNLKAPSMPTAEKTIGSANLKVAKSSTGAVNSAPVATKL